MSSPNDTKVGNAHARMTLRLPTVRPIPGYPNNFSVDFGDLSLHVTPEGWRQINAAVEDGFAGRRPVDIIGEYVRTIGEQP